MKKNPVVDPQKIHMMGLRIVKSYFEVELEVLEDPRDIEYINLGTKSESQFNLEEDYQLFKLFVKIHGLSEDGESICAKGEYQIDFHYKIDNLMDFVDLEKDSNGFSVKSMLGATIAGISYSTSRGIILDRTQTTDFAGVLLPVIDPNQLLNEDTFSEMR